MVGILSPLLNTRNLMLLPDPAKQIGLLVVTGVLLLVPGCATEEVEYPVVFEPNLVHTMKYQLKEDISMDEASKDSTWVVDTMFGNPDVPMLPTVIAEDEDLANIVNMDLLEHASGPATEEGRGLFRALCANCHGVTGDGRGKDASAQMPYPRDYRMGIFKFKSTPRGDKPTKEDLARVIRNGIAGTNMLSAAKLLETENFRRKQNNEPPLNFKEVTEKDIQALADYVVYLSLRGEHERQQVDVGIFEQILEGGDRLINSDVGQNFNWADRDKRDSLEKELESLEEQQASLEKQIELLDSNGESSESEKARLEEITESVENLERFEEEWEYAEEYAAEIAEAWLDGEDAVVDVPEPPADLPLAESSADVERLKIGPQAQEFAASLQRGHELFIGKMALCSKCHGEKGLGDGQTTDYDDWTKDWTKNANLDPKNREKLIPLLARGALPPVNIIPRNFSEGVFRGGATSKDLYLRITQGIEGTPMSAATFVEGQFEPEDVWHLINFIRSLEKPESNPQAATQDTTLNLTKAAP